MAFTPSSFLSNVRAKDGLAKPCRYEVVMPIPPYINEFVSNGVIEKILNFPNSVFSDVTEAINNAFGAPGSQENGYGKTSNAQMSRYLSLQCESAELPGRSIQTQDVKIYGPTFKVPYQTQYSETTFTFICTNDFFERKLFDKWLEAMHPSDTNNMRFPKGSSSRYMTNPKIIQYDDFIKQIYAVELIDAFPINVAPQPLSWSEDNFHRLSVQFAFHKYKPIYEGQYDLAASATELLGAVATRFLPFN